MLLVPLDALFVGSYFTPVDNNVYFTLFPYSFLDPDLYFVPLPVLFGSFTPSLFGLYPVILSISSTFTVLAPVAPAPFP